MISRLRGVLLEKQAPKIVLEVAGGIGYEVEVPLTTFDQLPDVDQTVTIHTHLLIRDDGQQLYGFYRRRDRQLFRILIKVNGVGPKLALAILSSMEPMVLVESVLHKDVAVLQRVPGVGKRTAQRLLVELYDRLTDWQMQHSSGDVSIDAISTGQAPAKVAMEEAISALVSLGYKPQLASRAINKIYVDDATSENLIREALKTLSVA